MTYMNLTLWASTIRSSWTTLTSTLVFQPWPSTVCPPWGSQLDLLQMSFLSSKCHGANYISDKMQTSYCGCHLPPVLSFVYSPCSDLSENTVLLMLHMVTFSLQFLITCHLLGAMPAGYSRLSPNYFPSFFSFRLLFSLALSLLEIRCLCACLLY